LPPAARGSFEKPPLDPAKLFINVISIFGSYIDRHIFFTPSPGGFSHENKVIFTIITDPRYPIKYPPGEIKGRTRG
jgi:hypothetical protein